MDGETIPAVHRLKLTRMHLSRPITLWIDEQVAHWGEFRRLMALHQDLAAFPGGDLKLRRTSAGRRSPAEEARSRGAVPRHHRPRR